MKKQRILSSLLALAMTFSLLPGTALAADVKDFVDVAEDAWYYDAVEYCVDEGFFVGTSATTFEPELTVDRAQFAMILANMEGVEVDNNVSPFEDVPAGTWYSGAVAWAAENGIVAGDGEGHYFPTTTISREQMAVVMNNYIEWSNAEKSLGHTEDEKVNAFGDADTISSWAVDAVEACRVYGLIVGAPDGNYYPLQGAARCHVATIISNLSFYMMGSTGGGSSKDYILKAVQAAVAEVKEDLGIEGDSVTVGGEHSFVSVDGLKVDKPKAKKDPRQVTVDATLTVDSGTISSVLSELVDYASEMAVSLLGSDSTKEDIKAIIKDVADELGVELNRASIEAKAEEIYNKVVAEGKGYARDIWANNFIVKDKYVTDDIVITAGAATATLVVDIENDKTYVDGSIAKVGAKLAKEIAKDLYADLKAVTEWKTLDEIALDANVVVTFSAGEYAKQTDKYSYEYPVTVNLAMAGDVAEWASYMYNGEHNVELAIPGVPAAYENIANKVISKVVSIVADKIADKAIAGINPPSTFSSRAVVDPSKITIDPDLYDALLTELKKDDCTSIYDNALLYNGVLSYVEELGYGELAEEHPELVDYAMAIVFNKIAGEDKFLTPEIAEKAEDKIANMDSEEIQDLVGSVGVDTSKYDQYMKYLDKLNAMKKFENAKKVRLGVLATALRSDFIAQYEFSFVDKVAALTAKMPAGIKITIEDLEISKATLADLSTATGAEVYEAVADLIDEIGDLSVSSFEDGVEVSVNGIVANLFVKF